MERVLVHRRQDFDKIRGILEEYNLPPSLSYMVLVETGFQFRKKSHAGAAGPWQFLPRTARAYGLTVNKETDQRYDVDKSTHAAARYIRDLIFEFGSGSSVMLALAAYNTGPTRVRRTIRKMDDPINQRNFWHLYRVKALPRETREYVPKIIAAIIVGRNPERFGFVETQGT
jgi:membrane-bound lytic murein transglycosylase D